MKNCLRWDGHLPNAHVVNQTAHILGDPAPPTERADFQRIGWGNCQQHALVKHDWNGPFSLLSQFVAENNSSSLSFLPLTPIS